MSSRRDRQIRSYIFRAIVGLAVIGLLGSGIWFGFRVVKKNRLMTSARMYAEKKEYSKAAFAAADALKIDRKDIAANRFMAEMADELQLKDAITLRRGIADMQPGVAQNLFDWADAALRFKDVASAKEAISRLDEAGRKTASFHDLSARLAVLTGQHSQVYAHVAAAAQLEPHNDKYQLQLAAVQLGSPVPEVRKAALARAEQLADSPTVRREALRTLIQTGLAEGDGLRVLKYSNELMRGPGGTFEDRMLYLKLLGKLKRTEYWWFLAQMGSELPESDDELVSLLSWMNNNGLSRLTLIWTDELPADRSERVPVCVSIAEAHALLGNWGKLKSLLRFQKWGDLEFQREALTARVAREEGDDTGSVSHWSAAVTLAGERRDALSALGRFAIAWKWEEEYTSLLWVIANGRGQPMPALQKLLKRFTAEGKTRDILRVFNRMLELDPQNLIAKNNVAYALLILNMETERAQTLAYEAWNADATNPEYNSTYALALYSKGKSDAALKILQGLEEQDRNTPSALLCYAIIAAEKGMNKEAAAALDIAEKGLFLPEEKTLASRTRAKLPR